jgi:hypothetical protein
MIYQQDDIVEIDGPIGKGGGQVFALCLNLTSGYNHTGKSHVA